MAWLPWSSAAALTAMRRPASVTVHTITAAQVVQAAKSLALGISRLDLSGGAGRAAEVQLRAVALGVGRDGVQRGRGGVVGAAVAEDVQGQA
jgi:hypothetical protein